MPPAAESDMKALDNAGLKVGDVLDGKYQIDRVLGSGGMGLVLAATHLTLRQQVALKLLLPSSLSDRLVVARFEREARAAAMLRSEHVARVLDVGHIPNGSPYMVMELLEGSDLEQIVEASGPLAIDVAVNYVLQACEAIAEAHALGIIHRDLKPHNLFLARRVDGEALVKVLDFGISKLPNEEDQALTRTRDVMGSPLYMAPEQLRSSRDVDPRADVWALGAILFRLVSARTPFDGETMAQLCARVLVEPPTPIRQARPDIPDGLALVIERCLEKEPNARFSSVAELARALDPFAAQTAVRAADRIVAISARPPPSVPPPPVSASPPHSQGTLRIGQVRPQLHQQAGLTGKSLPAIAHSEPPPKKRSWLPLLAVIALIGGAGGGYVLREKWQSKPAPPAPAPMPEAASIAPPPAVSSVAPPPLSPPEPVVAASATDRAEPAASHRAKRPIVPRRPVASAAAAPSAAPAPEPPPTDEAPDLRK